MGCEICFPPFWCHLVTILGVGKAAAKYKKWCYPSKIILKLQILCVHCRKEMELKNVFSTWSLYGNVVAASSRHVESSCFRLNMAVVLHCTVASFCRCCATATACYHGFANFWSSKVAVRKARASVGSSSSSMLLDSICRRRSSSSISCRLLLGHPRGINVEAIHFLAALKTPF